MSDVIDDLKNNSTSAAKDFVVSRIVEEAQREGTPLPGLERKIKGAIIP
jgi:hypothetical protein